MLGDYELVAFVGATDADRAQAFYEGVLGLTLREVTPYAVVFDANGTTLRVALSPSVSPAPGTVLGWTVPDMTSVVAALQAADVALARFAGMDQDERGVWTTPSGDQVAWFRDPDGNLLSVTEMRSS